MLARQFPAASVCQRAAQESLVYILLGLTGECLALPSPLLLECTHGTDKVSALSW